MSKNVMVILCRFQCCFLRLYLLFCSLCMDLALFGSSCKNWYAADSVISHTIRLWCSMKSYTSQKKKKNSSNECTLINSYLIPSTKSFSPLAKKTVLVCPKEITHASEHQGCCRPPHQRYRSVLGRFIKELRRMIL